MTYYCTRSLLNFHHHHLWLLTVMSAIAASSPSTSAVKKLKKPKPRPILKKSGGHAVSAGEVSTPRVAVPSSSQPARAPHEHAASEKQDVQMDTGTGADAEPWKPPAGAKQADLDVEFGAFEYDTVRADDEAELWLVRVPGKVRTAPSFMDILLQVLDCNVLCR